MGQRGPAPKPTALKRLQGNPGKRALNESEPRPAATLPRCPSHLQGEARAEWRRVARALHESGLLTQVDRAALAELRERVLALVEALAEALAEAFRPLMEVCQAIGEVVLRAGERVWELIGGVGEERAGRSADRSTLGSRHVNCRCLPVERVDPVRAGRTRWWTRK